MYNKLLSFFRIFAKNLKVYLYVVLNFIKILSNLLKNVLINIKDGISNNKVKFIFVVFLFSSLIGGSYYYNDFFLFNLNGMFMNVKFNLIDILYNLLNLFYNFYINILFFLNLSFLILLNFLKLFYIYIFKKFVLLISNFLNIYVNILVFCFYIIFKLVYTFIYIFTENFCFLNFFSFSLFRTELLSLILIYFLITIYSFYIIFIEFFYYNILDANNLINVFTFYKMYVINNNQKIDILQIFLIFLFEDGEKDFYLNLYNLFLNIIFKFQMLIFYYFLFIICFLIIFFKCFILIILKYLSCKLSILFIVSPLNIIFLDFSIFNFFEKIHILNNLDFIVYLNYFFNILFLVCIKYINIFIYFIYNYILDINLLFILNNLDFLFFKKLLKIILFDYFYNFFGNVLFLFYNYFLLLFSFYNLFFVNINIYINVFEIFKYNLDSIIFLFWFIIKKFVKFFSFYLNIDLMIFDFFEIFEDISAYLYIYFIKYFYIFYGFELDIFEYYIFTNNRKVKINIQDYYDYGYVYYYYFDFFWKKIFLYDYIYLSDLGKFFDIRDTLIVESREDFLEEQVNLVEEIYLEGISFDLNDGFIGKEHIILDELFLENKEMIPYLSYHKLFPHQQVVELYANFVHDMYNYLIDENESFFFINEDLLFLNEFKKFDKDISNRALLRIFLNSLMVDGMFEHNPDINDYYFDVFLKDGVRYEKSIWPYDVNNMILNNNRKSLKFISSSSIFRLEKAYLYLNDSRELILFNLNHFRLLIFVFLKFLYFLIFLFLFIYSGFFRISIKLVGYILYFGIYVFNKIKLFYLFKNIIKFILLIFFYPFIKIYNFLKYYLFYFNFNYFFWNFDEKLLNNYKKKLVLSLKVNKIYNNTTFNLFYFKRFNLFDFLINILSISKIINLNFFRGKFIFVYCNFILIYSWFVKNFSGIFERSLENLVFKKYDLNFVLKRGFVDNVDYFFRLDNWLNFKIKENNSNIYFLNFLDYPIIYLHSVLFERIFQKYILINNFKSLVKVENLNRFIIFKNILNLFFKSFPNLKVIYFQYYLFLKVLIYEYSNTFYKFLLLIPFKTWYINIFVFDYINVYKFKLVKNLLFSLSYIDNNLFNDLSRKNILLIQLLNTSELKLFRNSYSLIDKCYYFIENLSFNFYLFFNSFFYLLKIFFNIFLYIELVFKYIRLFTIFFILFAFFRVKYISIISDFDLLYFRVSYVFSLIPYYYIYYKFIFVMYFCLFKDLKKSLILINLLFYYFNNLNSLILKSKILILYSSFLNKLNIIYKKVFLYSFKKYMNILNKFVYYKILILPYLFHKFIFILINILIKLINVKINKLIILNIFFITFFIGFKLIFITIEFFLFFSKQPLRLGDDDESNVNSIGDSSDLDVGNIEWSILKQDAQDLIRNNNILIFIVNFIYLNFFNLFNLVYKWLYFISKTIFIYFKNLIIYLFSLFFFIKFLNFVVMCFIKFYVLFFSIYLYIYYYLYNLNILIKLKNIFYFIKIFNFYLFFEEINYFLYVLNFIKFLFFKIIYKFKFDSNVNKFFYLLNIIFKFEFVLIKNIVFNLKKIFLVRFKNKNIVYDFYNKNYELDFFKMNFGLNNNLVDNYNSLIFWKKIQKLELESDVNFNFFHTSGYNFIYETDPLIFLKDFSKDKVMVKYLLINCSQKFYLFLSLNIYSFESLYLFNNFWKMDYMKYKTFGSLIKFRFKFVNFSFDRFDFGINFLNHFSFFKSIDNRFYNDDYDYNLNKNNFIKKRLFEINEGDLVLNKFDFFYKVNFVNEKFLKIKLLIINKSFIEYNKNRSFLVKYKKLIVLNNNNIYRLTYNVGLWSILKILIYNIIIKFILNYFLLFFIVLLGIIYFDIFIIFLKNFYFLHVISYLDIYHYAFWKHSLMLFGDYFFDIIFLLFYYFNILLWYIFSNSFRQMLFDDELTYFDKYEESEQLKKNIPFLENDELVIDSSDDIGSFGLERDENLFKFELRFFAEFVSYEQYFLYNINADIEAILLDVYNYSSKDVLDGDLEEMFGTERVDLENTSDEYSGFSVRSWFLIVFPFFLWSFIFLDQHITGDSLPYFNTYVSLYDYEARVGPEALPRTTHGRYNENYLFDFPNDSEWSAKMNSSDIVNKNNLSGDSSKIIETQKK